MPLTGNKGEWSEIYAFLKLLADGEMASGDGKLNARGDITFPILKIFRSDSPERTAYVVNGIRKAITISGKQIELTLPQTEFATEATKLLASIKAMKTTTSSFPSTEEFMSKVGCENIKAKSADKADIRIVIHDLRTSTTPELGYSIKSKLGGKSTLINANKDNSNMVYAIKGFPKEKMSDFNALGSFKRKFKMIAQEGATVEWIGTAKPALNSNLQMLDSSLPRLVGECLLFYYSGVANRLDDIAELLKEQNPLRLDIDTQPLMYEYKLRHWLLTFALGMTVSKPWDSHFNANGGYIVVREDGDIVCYHFFDRNELEGYLLHNTGFETPSTAKHLFGDMEADDNGNLFLKLGLQVRFR